MNILWAPRAVEDFIELRAHIAENSPAAAERMTARIRIAIYQSLADNPSIGRPGRIPGTRELVVSRTPYIIPYQVVDGTIEILRVYHGARRWPDNF